MSARLSFIVVAALSLSGCFYLFDRLDDNRRTDYISQHSKLSPTRVEQIKKGQIQIGMTPEEVVASWGVPMNKNRSVTAFGANEQWVYAGNHYVYFDNDVLTSFQDFEAH